MTIRAVIMGLFLGLGIAAGTYFNDKVINQTMLIGNHLPIGVLGAAVILLLVINPLLRLGGRGWPLRGAEVGVIVAIGLAACGWPGSSFFRSFNTVAGVPAHWLKTKTAWQAAHVMSYVPGASADLAPGHVQDWPGLLGRLSSPGDEVEAAMASSLSPQTRRMITLAMDDGQVDQAEQSRLLAALNQDLITPVGEGSLYAKLDAADRLPDVAAAVLTQRASLLEQDAASAREVSEGASTADWLRGYLTREADHRGRHANRAALAELLGPSVVLPAPQGAGILAASGRADPFVVDTLLQGRGPSEQLGLLELPWRAWWEPIRLWWSLALLMGLGALCLTLVVHPQWSRRELLPYPIARFVAEAVDRKPDSWLPEVARQKMFWFAFLALVAVHSINGLHVWFNQVPSIPLTFDFNALRELFPTASRVWGSYGYFKPRLYLSVIAFAFFLSGSVSLSLGVSQLLFVVVGSWLLLQGVQFEQGGLGPKNTNLMRFGAYFGMALMIGYTGRRYYANVLASAVGWPRRTDTPDYAVWAARGLIVTTVLSVLVVRWSGLDWLMATLFVGLVLLIYLVVTRIVVETGAFFVQAAWSPVGVLTALLGFEAIGPTAYVLLAVASLMMIADPREVLMPYLANGLQIVDRTGQARPARVSPWLALMAVASLLVAGAATLYLQYNHGLSAVDEWTKGVLPTMPFDELAQHVSDARADHSIDAATAMSPLERFSHIAAVPGAYRWMLLGMVLVIGCAVARLRLPWWPLHPVAFLVWGTYPAVAFGFSFLLGWMVKGAVVRTSGARGYHSIKPMMVGIIAGELFAGLLWIVVGAAYYFATGKPPARYSIFPA